MSSEYSRFPSTALCLSCRSVLLSADRGGRVLSLLRPRCLSEVRLRCPLCVVRAACLLSCREPGAQLGASGDSSPRHRPLFLRVLWHSLPGQRRAGAALPRGPGADVQHGAEDLQQGVNASSDPRTEADRSAALPSLQDLPRGRVW